MAGRLPEPALTALVGGGEAQRDSDSELESALPDRRSRRVRRWPACPQLATWSWPVCWYPRERLRTDGALISRMESLPSRRLMDLFNLRLVLTDRARDLRDRWCRVRPRGAGHAPARANAYGRTGSRPRLHRPGPDRRAVSARRPDGAPCRAPGAARCAGRRAQRAALRAGRRAGLAGVRLALRPAPG